MAVQRQLKVRRQGRVRRRIRRTPNARPRLSVFRSNRHIYAQVIDDSRGETLAAASSLEEAVAGGSGREAAVATGRLVAERAVDKGLREVVFDRGAYLYHGRVRALAEAAREAGLVF